MSRHSARDRAFARAFASQLRKAFEDHAKDKANPDRISVEKFAESLNLTRAGLHKAMKGRSVPKIDLIERARKYDVEVKYGGLAEQLAEGKRRKPRLDIQPMLPLIIESLKKDNVKVELGDHHGYTLQLKVSIRFTG